MVNDVGFTYTYLHGISAVSRVFDSHAMHAMRERIPLVAWTRIEAQDAEALHLI